MRDTYLDEANNAYNDAAKIGCDWASRVSPPRRPVAESVTTTPVRRVG